MASNSREWLGQGELDAKLCHAHRHNRLDNSSERLFSPSLFFSLSLSVSSLLNCSLTLRFVPHLFWFLSPSLLSLYIPYLLPLYPRYFLSSLTFAPFHRHPVRVVSSSSFSLTSLLPFLSVPYLRFFALFLSHPPLIISFTFSQPPMEQSEAGLNMMMILRASGFLRVLRRPRTHSSAGAIKIVS